MPCLEALHYHFNYYALLLLDMQPFCSDGIARKSMMLAFLQMLEVAQTHDIMIIESTNVLLQINFYRKPTELENGL